MKPERLKEIRERAETPGCDFNRYAVRDLLAHCDAQAEEVERLRGLLRAYVDKTAASVAVLSRAPEVAPSIRAELAEAERTLLGPVRAALSPSPEPTPPNALDREEWSGYVPGPLPTPLTPEEREAKLRLIAASVKPTPRRQPRPPGRRPCAEAGDGDCDHEPSCFEDELTPREPNPETTVRLEDVRGLYELVRQPITAESLKAAPREPEPAPCGGSRCFQADDGTWIHSSKSYGTCAVRCAEPAPEAPHLHQWTIPRNDGTGAACECGETYLSAPKAEKCCGPSDCTCMGAKCLCPKCVALQAKRRAEPAPRETGEKPRVLFGGTTVLMPSSPEAPRETEPRRWTREEVEAALRASYGWDDFWRALDREEKP